MHPSHNAPGAAAIIQYIGLKAKECGLFGVVIGDGAVNEAWTCSADFHRVSDLHLNKGQRGRH